MRLLKPLFALLAAATDSQLARMVEYLKAENRILRVKLPRRLAVTKQDRVRLVKLGRALGSALAEIITIVSPRTFTRWVAGEKKPTSQAEGKPGRPKTDEDIRKLVLRLANENGWGYTRILGELTKLGHRAICRSTVVNILKEAGLDPGPKRGEVTWSDFLNDGQQNQNDDSHPRLPFVAGVHPVHPGGFQFRYNHTPQDCTVAQPCERFSVLHVPRPVVPLATFQKCASWLKF